MKPVFADTSYFLAFLGEKDQHHERAVAWTCTLRARVVTTEYITIEVGNSEVDPKNWTIAEGVILSEESPME
jgi:predicted nucleic acid-binding protein